MHNTYKTQPLVNNYHQANFLKVEWGLASVLNLELSFPNQAREILTTPLLHFKVKGNFD